MKMDKQIDFFQYENSLYLPMHSDNWAYFLSSGYIGGAYFENLSNDFQNNTGFLISGFKKFPPSWALIMGDIGAKVVVEIDVTDIKIETHNGYYVAKELIKLTKAKKVYFSSNDELKNFNASYNLFNDVPNNIITTSVISFPKDEKSNDNENFKRIKNNDFEELRIQKDLFCGWTSELLDCLEQGNEKTILSHLLKPRVIANQNEPIKNVIISILHAAQGNNYEIDELIWEITAGSVLDKRSFRGFDKFDLIKEIEEKLSANNNINEEIKKWLTTCKKVISAEQNLESYNDEKGKLGRLASLYLIMAHKIDDVNNLITNKSLGPEVGTMLKLVAGAFDGFSRSETERKKDLNKLAILLELSECIQNGVSSEIQPTNIELNHDLSYQIQNYKHKKDIIFKKKLPLPTYIQQLKFCAQKSKIKLYKAEDNNLIYLLNDKGIKIYCDITKNQNEEVIVFYIPILNNNFLKDNNYLIDIMKLAADIGTPIGIRLFDNEETICSIMYLLTDTLDQDEFDYAINQLAKFPAAVDNLIKTKKYKSKKTIIIKKNNEKNIG